MNKILKQSLPSLDIAAKQSEVGSVPVDFLRPKFRVAHKR